MDQQAVTDALSEATIAVAQDELDRLSRGLDSNQKAERVEYALNQLGGLRSSEMPEYGNRWVALFYTTWYQPRQINISYRIVKSYLKESNIDRDKALFAIDFGCGALAMQFGIALAFADTSNPQDTMPEISILSMDSSKDMIRIGRRIWTKFKENVDTDDRLVFLSQICNSIKYGTMSYQFSEEPITLPSTWLDTPPDSYRWISAIHTVYEENLNQVRNLLQFLANSFNPDVGFITSQNYQENVRRSREVSPFSSERGYESPNINIRPGFAGPLSQITRWRSNLPTELGSVEIARSDYLTRPVRWDTRGTNFMIFRKTEEDDLPW